MKNKQMKTGTSSISWMLLSLFIWSIVQPTITYAGGGGPTQPESSAFTPIGVTDMVDPFTGDFTYNIPLMDIEGYPINIAYNSGVTMDQEASWVGLGWNLNAGSIVRNLRGLPDDFNGDKVVKTQNLKPTFNMSVDAGVSVEILGLDISKLTKLSLNAGLSFNNYSGFGASTNVGVSFDIAKSSGSKLTSGFSLSGSSENGASFSPSISLSKFDDKQVKTTTIGTAFNSRAGLQSLSYGFSQDKLNARRSEISKTPKKLGERMSGVNGSFDLGLAQYLPVPSHPKVGMSTTFQLNIAGTVFGLDGQGNIGVALSRQWIDNDKKELKVPSFGYMYHENGLKSSSNQLDFNRDNDQPFTKYSVNLPSAFQTYDLFSIQAQGTSGSFRTQRNDVSYVFDAKSITLDVGASVGVEIGFGNLTDVGVDVQIPVTTSYSGLWSNSNPAKNSLNAKGANDIVPSFGFVEASESSVQTDDLMTSQFNGLNPEKLVLEGSSLFPRVVNKLNQNGNEVSISRNSREKRELTNNQLYMLTRSEVVKGLGVFPLNSDIYVGARDHHISEITQLGQDGRRYVFALPAYNQFQEDVTFATGNGMYSSDGILYAEDNSGLISYSSTDASVNNKKGIDNYYNSVLTPAYAHSYMLSAVLSDDFIDVDEVPGPSNDDLGSFVKFNYKKVKDHEWRSPQNSGKAFYNEGLRTDDTDDKASFTHGKKDLFYLQYVETKNYIAVFETTSRHDGYSAQGRDGGFNTSNSNLNSLCLVSITLYSKADIAAQGGIAGATPIQKVEFKYNYSRCPGYPANVFNYQGGGKLTLTDIIFSYQNSKKMVGRGYHFDYSSENPAYNIKASDRWGTYKQNPSGSETNINTPLNNAEYPYSEQNKAIADINASAWSLTNIKLPSGGEIEVTYESDDYQFVQHKKAGQMFQIIGTAFYNGSNYDTDICTSRSNLHFVDLTSNSNGNNPYLLFQLDNPYDDLSKYAVVGQQLYFRALVELNPDGANFKEQTEFVSGYGIIDEIKTIEIGSVNYGAIKLKGERFTDNGNDDYSPITKQAILFGRAQLSRTITQSGFPQNSNDPAGEQAIKDLANAMIGSIASFKELATGPNKFVFDQDKGKRMVPLSSWMRLNCPSGRKLGGGSRVKEIKMKDKWDVMSGGVSKTYGQRFKYELEDGSSSGVASYEPQLGGDENPWHSAYIVNNKRRLAMDDKMYIEDPIMESQFPSPSVGYSRVIVEDIGSESLGVNGTGKVVKEFYTARDFPTIVKSTTVDILPKNSLLPLLPKYQYLTANQGFSIELNDMHGKPKKESVYGQNQSQPLSTVEYFYQSEDLGLNGVSNKRLKNSVNVIDDKGNVSQQTIGIRYDEVADFRESKTVTQVPALHFNTNSFFVSVIPLFLPTIYPGYDRTTNRFRSSTMNKTVQRFGILEKTVANQDGSVVETNNLAYDAQTGQVLVTQTTTDFNDKVYSLNYPAYWKYPSFGQASKNVMYSYTAASISNNGFVNIPSDLNHFVEGDEVSVSSASSAVKGWVLEKNVNGIRIVNKMGMPITGSNMTIKVIRSGFKNKQSTSMASMTSLDNPIDNISTNQFSQVLNAGAVEFGQDWKTYCDCFLTPNEISTNPYVLGTKGSWRPIKSYTYLSGRTQSNIDGNTNIRKDGVFSSYSPFYKLNNGNWVKDGLNWTFVSEVTQFSPNGMTLETKDALGRYSSSLFGFNNTLTTAVAANAKMTQIAYGSFEDLNAAACTDAGYFNKAYYSGNQNPILSQNRTTVTAHTGRTSIVVTPTTPVTFQNIISTCAEENLCDLALTCVYQMNACDLINISGGSNLYTMEFEAIGDASAEMISANQLKVNINTSSNVNSLIITVTDSNGCKAAKKITVSKGIVYSEIINF